MNTPETTGFVPPEGPGGAPATGTTIAEYNATENALATLRETYANKKYDVATTAGMKEATKARAEIRTYRTALETKRKALKKPALDYSRRIDSEAKRITEQLRALEDPIDAQITAQERAKEQERERRAAEERERIAQAERDRLLAQQKEIDDARAQIDKERAELERQRKSIEASNAEFAEARRKQEAANAEAERARQEEERRAQDADRIAQDAQTRAIQDEAVSTATPWKAALAALTLLENSGFHQHIATRMLRAVIMNGAIKNDDEQNHNCDASQATAKRVAAKGSASRARPANAAANATGSADVPAGNARDDESTRTGSRAGSRDDRAAKGMAKGSRAGRVRCGDGGSKAGKPDDRKR